MSSTWVDAKTLSKLMKPLFVSYDFPPSKRNCVKHGGCYSLNVMIMITIHSYADGGAILTSGITKGQNCF